MCEIFMRDPGFIRRTRVPRGAAVIRLYRRREQNRKTGAFARRKLSKRGAPRVAAPRRSFKKSAIVPTLFLLLQLFVYRSEKRALRTRRYEGRCLKKIDFVSQSK